MGVELSATAVDWSILLSKIEEKPTRLRRAKFLFGALEKREPWLEDLSEPLDPTDSTMTQAAEAYDRVRGLVEPEARERFDRYARAFFWMATARCPHDGPPVRDLGPKSDPQVFFSSFSPDSVASYLETWRSLNPECLRDPFEHGKGHIAFNGSKARNASLFEGRFWPYLVQWGGVLQAASDKGRGLIVSYC